MVLVLSHQRTEDTAIRGRHIRDALVPGGIIPGILVSTRKEVTEVAGTHISVVPYATYYGRFAYEYECRTELAEVL